MAAPAQRDWVRDYLAFLTSQRQLAAHTVGNYGRDLRQLQQLAKDSQADSELAGLNHFDIRKFAAQLHARGLRARSIARELSAWRGFFDWLAQQMELASNPVAGVKPPKRARPLPKALAVDDAVRLVSRPNPRALTVRRRKPAIRRCSNCCIQAACGCRNWLASTCAIARTAQRTSPPAGSISRPAKWR